MCSFTFIGMMCFLHSRKRRLCLRYVCCALIILVIIGMVIIHRRIDDEKCSNEELRSMLHSVIESIYSHNLFWLSGYKCGEYKRSEAAGSLCRPMCDESQVHYIKCLNYKHGKKIIFASWDDKTIILKAKHTRLKSYESMQYIPTLDAFMTQLRSKFKMDYGAEDKRSNADLIMLLWTGAETYEELNNSDNPHKKVQQRTAFMRSLWSLVQQDEYLFMQYFRDNPHLPRIYGSCGHVYAMEYAPSTGVLDPDILQVTGVSTYAWQERVKIAIDLLKVIQSAEEDFGEPLHFCDVKGSNFGIGQNGRVKPIDTDTVFLRTKAEDAIASQGRCENDETCTFFDCLGQCNKVTGRCDKKVINNNLEAVCRKIFTHRAENMFHGLLASPPQEIKAELSDVLNECLLLTGDNLSDTERVFQNLYTLLQKSNNFN